MHSVLACIFTCGCLLPYVEFDAIYGRVQAAGIAYGSGPFDHQNMQINSARRGGRAFYFEDIDGHLLEVMTA